MPNWIASRLSGWGVVGSTAPRGFEAYARIFHPAEGRTWREVADQFDRTWHPAMQWYALVGEADIEQPRLGQLPYDQLSTLAGILARHTNTPDAATAGIWLGYGAVIAPATDRLELPSRDYALQEATVTEFADDSWRQRAAFSWNEPFDNTPNLLWPADHAWFVASEIDFDSTIVAGSRALIDEVVASELEAAEVTEDTDLSSTADTINAVN